MWWQVLLSRPLSVMLLTSISNLTPCFSQSLCVLFWVSTHTEATPNACIRASWILLYFQSASRNSFTSAHAQLPYFLRQSVFRTWMCCNSFNESPTDWHWGCCQSFAITSNTAVDNLVVHHFVVFIRGKFLEAHYWIRLGQCPCS